MASDYGFIDTFLSSVSSQSIEKIWLAPSFFDPTSNVWPMPPFNALLLPKSSSTNRIGFCGNPFHLELLGKSLLCSDGANYSDWAKNCMDPNVPLEELVKVSLMSRCFAPTAPNTLPSFPFEDNDPFVLRHTPDYIIVGNQETGSSIKVSFEEPCSRLVRVPSFNKAGEVSVLFPTSGQLETIRFRFDQVSIL